MPELPEVEVIKLFLESKLLNKKISTIEILNPKSFVGDPEKILNKKIIKFTRHGKQLSIHLSNKLILLVHLKMTGQLVLSPLSSKGVPEGQGILMGHPTKISSMPNNSTRIIFEFSPSLSREGSGEGLGSENEEVLFFNDQRKFGWVRIFSTKELKLFQSDLGLDIFDPLFTPNYFYQALQRSSAPIKTVLLNQKFFAGIGNIYANDALFLAKIHPSTSSNKVQRTKALKLYRSLISIMQQSVLAGGSTMKDQQFIRPDGSFGQNQFFFRVYQRTGQPCLVCGTPIEKTKVGSRGTFFCPACQKL